MNISMPYPRQNTWLTCILLSVFVLPVTSFAQEADRWYQVELIVFEQGGNPSDSEELWRTDIELQYPRNWLALVEQSDDSSLETEEDWSTAAEPESSENALPLLSADELTLGNEAQRLERNNQYRVLFHGGWRQPFAENRQEPAILITGGEQYGDHYELEGSIQLSLRTYLHIDTNLWLARFNTNFGQERAPWPPLPQRPNQRVDTDILFRFDGGNSSLQQPFNQNWDYEAILAQPYVVENIVVLNQSRRMRSGEIHYLDHPQMGLLIKLTPYEQTEE